MKLGRFFWNGRVVYGAIEDDRVLSVSGDIFGQVEVRSELCKVQDERFLPPVEPRSITALGINYPKRVDQFYSSASETSQTQRPVLFLMPTSSVIGPLEQIVLPTNVKQLDAAAEPVVVMKRQAKSILAEEASDYILGYTCGNDLAAPDLYDDLYTTLRAHGFDTATSFGPCIETGVSPEGLAINLRINGEAVVEGNTANMLHSVNMIISYISQFMTLCPGDIIFTGTPLGAPVDAGDMAEVSIEGLGTLSDEVVAAG